MAEKRRKRDEDHPRDRQKEEKEKESPPVDEYTGEPEPEAEDAGKVVEIVPFEERVHIGENYLLEEEDSLDKLALDEQADVITEQASHYTEDEEIAEDFEERQRLAAGGREELEEDLEEHHAVSPDLSGDDIDAEWEDTDVTGEESVGGTVVTPDQDVVSELGEAVGIEYEDDEPLHTEEKLRKRDRKRWELDPRSAEDTEEDEGETG